MYGSNDANGCRKTRWCNGSNDDVWIMVYGCIRLLLSLKLCFSIMPYEIFWTLKFLQISFNKFSIKFICLLSPIIVSILNFCSWIISVVTVCFPVLPLPKRPVYPKLPPPPRPPIYPPPFPHPACPILSFLPHLTLTSCFMQCGCWGRFIKVTNTENTWHEFFKKFRNISWSKFNLTAWDILVVRENFCLWNSVFSRGVSFSQP